MPDPVSTAAAQTLTAQLLVAGLPAQVDQYNTIWVINPPIQVYIMARQHYCDRGNWSVHAQSLDPTKLCIDHADWFPRYFFFNDCLIKELHRWMQVRLAQVNQTIDPTCQELPNYADL